MLIHCATHCPLCLQSHLKKLMFIISGKKETSHRIKGEPVNYRPISITLLLAKYMESFSVEAVNEHMMAKLIFGRPAWVCTGSVMHDPTAHSVTRLNELTGIRGYYRRAISLSPTCRVWSEQSSSLFFNGFSVSLF